MTSKKECEDSLRSQFVTLEKDSYKTRGGRQYLPYVFTEQGVAMLSAVLHSSTAIQVSIRIMDAFVKLRHYVSSQIVKTDDKAELAEIRGFFCFIQTIAIKSFQNRIKRSVRLYVS